MVRTRRIFDRLRQNSGESGELDEDRKLKWRMFFSNSKGSEMLAFASCMICKFKIRKYWRHLWKFSCVGGWFSQEKKQVMYSGVM